MAEFDVHLVQLRFNLIKRLEILRRRRQGLHVLRGGERNLVDLEQLPLVELLRMALDVAVDFVLGNRAHLGRQVALNEGAGKDLLA